MKIISIKTFLVLITTVFCIQLHAQLKTAKLFTHHAVLQRNKPIPVWGWAEKNQTITVIINGITVKAKTNADSKWIAVLPAMKEGGPYQLAIASKKEKITLNDIMIGEVWICSGQSNMEWTMKDAYGFKTEKANAGTYPIRQFEVSKELAFEPAADLTKGEWVNASPEVIGDFTAVGYFFAKELSQKLGVTVGLINSSWGGSQAEGWISKESMQSSPLFKQYADKLPSSWQEADKRRTAELKQYAYNNETPVLYDGSFVASQDISFYSKWHSGYAPGSWDWQGKWSAYRGRGFMQKTILMGDAETTKQSTLKLANKDGYVDVYINGKRLYAGEIINHAMIELPAGVWKKGENNLLLHVSSQKNPDWFGPGIEGNKNDLYVQFDDTTVNISDDKWRLMPDFKNDFHFQQINNRVGATIYNAMLHPLVPYAMQGVIWYQGETNSGRSYEYRTTFPLLINDWRSKWKNDFPFLFVQLSSFNGQQSSNEGSGWAELREAQALALSLPNTGMAVTIDIGDADDVHPRNKEDVGKRLAANAFKKVYGIDVPFAGPTYKSVEFKNGNAIVSFDYTGSGLLVKDKYNYPKAFEIAGADKKWYYAKAEITGDKIKVWSESVKVPVAVRYAWTDAPIDANVFNREGFPAAPFRTDDWPCVTLNSKFE